MIKKNDIFAISGKLGIAGIALYQMMLRDVFHFPRWILYLFGMMCLVCIGICVVRQRFDFLRVKELFMLMLFHGYMLFAAYFASPNFYQSHHFWTDYSMDYLIVLTVIALICSDEDCELPMAIISIGAIAMAVMLIFVPSMRYGTRRLVLSEDMNANYLGLIMAFGALQAIYLRLFSKKQPIVGVVFVGVIIYAIMLTGSRKSLVAILLMVLPYIIGVGKQLRTYQKWAFIILLIIALIWGGGFLLEAYDSLSISDRVEASGSSDTDQARLDMYMKAFDMFWDNPIIGYGYQGYMLHYRTTYSHSTISELLVSGGLIGVLIYASAFVMAIRRTLRLRRIIKSRPNNAEALYKVNTLLVAWAVIVVLMFVIILFYGTLYQTYICMFVCCAYSMERKIAEEDMLELEAQGISEENLPINRFMRR